MRLLARTGLGVGTLALLGIIASAVLLADEHGATEAKEEAAQLPSPIVSTHELMEIFNEPLYHDVSEAVKEKPADKNGWAEIHELGVKGAEIINLVSIRKRAEKQDKEWKMLSREAQMASLGLAQAANDQDWQAVRMAARALVKNCNDCHGTMAPDHAPQLALPER